MTRHLHTHRFSQRGQLHSKVPLFIQITTSCYQRDAVRSLYLHHTTQTADILTMNTTQSHPRWRNKLSCHWETLWIKESEIYTQGRDAQGVIMMLLGPHNLQMNYRGMIFLYCLQHIMMRPNTVIICWAEQSAKKLLRKISTRGRGQYEKVWTHADKVGLRNRRGSDVCDRFCPWWSGNCHTYTGETRHAWTTHRHICCTTHPPTQTYVYTHRQTHTM